MTNDGSNIFIRLCTHSLHELQQRICILQHAVIRSTQKLIMGNFTAANFGIIFHLRKSSNISSEKLAKPTSMQKRTRISKTYF